MMMMIKLQTWKRRKRKTKTNYDQGKGIKRFLFGTQETIEGVSGFRIDSHTIKREKLIVCDCGYQVPLAKVIHAFALGPSVLTINP